MDRIVIIGGGFAGLRLLKKLDSRKYRVMLVDKNNFHSFPPLYYQVASSGLGESDISFPFRREFRHRNNVSYHIGHVKHVDIEKKIVKTSYEEIAYDKLIIAAGSTNNYFNIPGIEGNVFGIKSIPQANHCRSEILDRLERGAICKDKKRRRELLSFMVVGGGPSGVEIAGALGEMKRYVIKREYPELDVENMTITLVEGGDTLLNSMSKKAGAKALKYLNELMVDVHFNTFVSGYSDKIVSYGNGEREYCETLIWTAGVKGEPIPGLPTEMIGRGGRILTDEYNRVSGRDDLFAIGDISLIESETYPNGHPQVAQVAIQQANTLAKNLNSEEFSKKFEYQDKGSMATIGRHRAVIDMQHTFLSGITAWLIWMLIHLVSILGMRNKLNVVMNWCWNYLNYSSSLRLLHRPTRFPERRHWGD